MKNKKKIFVSCGEMSGDLHLSYIIEEMKKQDPNLEFCGVVGDNSINAGAIKINHRKNINILSRRQKNIWIILGKMILKLLFLWTLEDLT